MKNVTKSEETESYQSGKFFCLSCFECDHCGSHIHSWLNVKKICFWWIELITTVLNFGCKKKWKKRYFVVGSSVTMTFSLEALYEWFINEDFNPLQIDWISPSIRMLGWSGFCWFLMQAIKNIDESSLVYLQGHFWLNRNLGRSWGHWWRWRRDWVIAYADFAPEFDTGLGQNFCFSCERNLSRASGFSSLSTLTLSISSFLSLKITNRTHYALLSSSPLNIVCLLYKVAFSQTEIYKLKKIRDNAIYGQK